MTDKAAPNGLPKDTFYQIYRPSTLGSSLFEALDELIQSGHVNADLAVRVLAQFDKSASTVFSERLKARCSVRSHLKTYNYCDDVWTFDIRDATFKFENNQESIGPMAGKCKIVACKAADAAPNGK